MWKYSSGTMRQSDGSPAHQSLRSVAVQDDSRRINVPTSNIPALRPPLPFSRSFGVNATNQIPRSQSVNAIRLSGCRASSVRSRFVWDFGRRGSTINLLAVKSQKVLYKANQSYSSLLTNSSYVSCAVPLRRRYLRLLTLSLSQQPPNYLRCMTVKAYRHPGHPRLYNLANRGYRPMSILALSYLSNRT